MSSPPSDKARPLQGHGENARTLQACATPPPASSVVELLPVSAVHPTPENWSIYRKTDEADPAWLELCQSVAAVGITTPLEISRDRFIISGHRRYSAAVQCGLSEVRCITDEAIVMGELSAPERIALLTERNRGIRIKTDGELYLEAAAAVDPEEAIRRVEARKAQVFTKVKKSGLKEVKSVGDIRRTDPSGERAEMLRAVLGLMEEQRENGFLPTGARNLHYKLLRKNVRTSTRKNGYIYGRRNGSDKLLSKLLTDARSAGLIDPADINDASRRSWRLKTESTPAKYVTGKLDGLFSGYFSDVHADQPNYVEILVEKDTIGPLIWKHVGADFRLTVTSLHGYGSYPAARDVAARFKASGKEKLVVIYISDLDPEGIDMPASWKKYLKHDFGVEAAVYRAAVTLAQVQKYDLPADADVKLSSTRAEGFISHYGSQCWPEKIIVDRRKRRNTRLIGCE